MTVTGHVEQVDIVFLSNRFLANRTFGLTTFRSKNHKELCVNNCELASQYGGFSRTESELSVVFNLTRNYNTAVCANIEETKMATLKLLSGSVVQLGRIQAACIFRRATSNNQAAPFDHCSCFVFLRLILCESVGQLRAREPPLFFLVATRCL